MSKINVQQPRGLPKLFKINKMQLSECEVILDAPVRVNIHCLMHDIRLC